MILQVSALKVFYYKVKSLPKVLIQIAIQGGYRIIWKVFLGFSADGY